MSTFGSKLRHERESRKLGIQEVAERTGVGLDYLEALEGNDFEALPGPRGFGKLYIRAYARVLGFDPAPLIEEFEKERRRQSRIAAGPAVRPAPRIRRIRYEPPSRSPESTEPAPPPGAEQESVSSSETTEPASIAVSQDAFVPKEQDAVDPLVAPTEAAGPPKTAIEPPDRRAESEPSRAVEPDLESSPVARPESPGLRRIVGLVLLGVVGIVAVVFVLRRESPSSPPIDRTNEPFVSMPQPEAVRAEPEAVRAEPEAAADTSVAPSTILQNGLRVVDAAVGTAVSNHRLLGAGTRFVEGSPASFFTRVLDGVSEKRIRHVWLHEGRVMQSRNLPVRSPNWRTYSSKTLWGTGTWAAEARSTDGRVLARVEFICEPR